MNLKNKGVKVQMKALTTGTTGQDGHYSSFY